MLLINKELINHKLMIKNNLLRFCLKTNILSGAREKNNAEVI